MKHQALLIFLTTTLLMSCTSQRKLAYLRNLPEPSGQDTFRMEIPDYRLQPRDVLYITAKAMSPDGTVKDFLTAQGTMMSYANQADAGGTLFGYNINSEGIILIPALGKIKVSGLNIEQAHDKIQKEADKIFLNSTVECKLMTFRYTVIGEVKAPGAYLTYNTYLTILEAIGRAGGVGDLGNRDRALVVRTSENSTQTFRVNLQDNNLLISPAYFLMPGDVVIIEPMKQKVFNLNLPVVSFLITSVTSTITMAILLINYLK
jgi:polysaccharide biosynthesis/export protein